MWWGGNKVKRNLQIRNKVRAVKYKYKNDTNKEKRTLKTRNIQREMKRRRKKKETITKKKTPRK